MTIADGHAGVSFPFLFNFLLLAFAFAFCFLLFIFCFYFLFFFIFFAFGERVRARVLSSDSASNARALEAARVTRGFPSSLLPFLLGAFARGGVDSVHFSGSLSGSPDSELGFSLRSTRLALPFFSFLPFFFSFFFLFFLNFFFKRFDDW